MMKIRLAYQAESLLYQKDFRQRHGSADKKGIIQDSGNLVQNRCIKLSSYVQ